MISCEVKHDSVDCKIAGTGKALLDELTAVIQCFYEANKEAGIKIILNALDASGFMDILSDEVGGLPDNIDELIESAMKEARGE